MATKPKALVFRAAGTNCDRETVHALKRAGADPDLVHLNRVLEQPEMLSRYRIAVFPGGFTYGDDLGAGTIFANRLREGLLAPMKEFVQRGCLVLGICNGFQILVKMGFLPGLAGLGEMGEATLDVNDSCRFEDRWIRIEGTSDRSPFVSRGQHIFCPAAHGEGKFIPRDRKILDQLEQNDQVVFRYVGPDGESLPSYPHNPNGSINAIAGICDPSGRVLGLMPHPERHLEATHHPTWTRSGLSSRGEGLVLFENAVRYVTAD